VAETSPGAIYAETRERVAALVSSLSPEELSAKVPATPAWSPRDIVGHLAGVASDVVTGNVAGRGSDPWTAAQVDARRARSLTEVLEEWAGTAPRLESFLDRGVGLPDILRVVADCYLHEQDIRGATDRPGARGAAGMHFSLELVIANLGARLEEAGLPGLRLRARDREWLAGPSEPEAAVTAPDEFELLRCLYSRRSRAQVAALDWAGDAERYLDTLGRFPFAESDIIE
jgi:uncharacterized protein (TIGR03083 family)